MNTFASLSVRISRLTRATLLASAFAAGACIAYPALAQDTKAADTTAYTLAKRVFKTGDVNRYKLGMKVHLGDMESIVNLLFRETIQDAKPGGEFTALNQFETASANIGGSEQDLMAFLPTVTVMRDKAGKLTNKTEGGIDAASAQISGMMQSLSTMQEAYLPKTPVKFGDKWKVSVSTTGPAGGAQKSAGEATLVGTEIIGGVKSYKLKVIAEVDNKEQDVKAHTESTMNLDPDSGKLLKMLSKVDGTAGGMKVSQELELNLVPTEKAAAAPVAK